ncbi:penicillin binding protein PBP4B [Lentilactobacillus otakiensis]|uniref:penicillin binding protein PBP4B n=1 Tax=Lentilactobacillus otakiensis TaxID=481720 RepID=UPI003D165115
MGATIIAPLAIGTQVTHASATPSGQYQLDESFPVNEKDDNPNFDTWSLLDNQQDRFYGFKGQGSVWVKTQSHANKIFINGKSLSISKIKLGQWKQLSIKKLTKNGNNAIQVNSLSTSKPVSIKVPYPKLVNQASAKTNRTNDSFKLIDQLIKSQVKNGFPSAQLVVVHNGQILKKSAYGLLNNYTPAGKRITTGAKATNSSLYDLASNTKMFATNFAVQKLVSEKKLDIDAKISSIFPEFKDPDGSKITGKADLTIRDIMEHQAGFPADPQYFNNYYDPDNPSTPKKDANPLYTQDRSEILSKIIATPLSYKPGTKTIYSDVDYMLLGLIVEKVIGERLDTYVENQIYHPLGLTHTVFNPLVKGFGQNQIAATEIDGNQFGGTTTFNNIRTYTLQGEVQDGKAYYNMEGVSGHAGLFSDATDLAALGQVVINGGGYGNHQVFDENTLDEFIKPKSSDPTYGLGWRRNALGAYGWAFSDLSDPSTVGHTGWTGTVTAIDPKDNTVIILLTNERNTPFVNPKENPTNFVGDHYLTAKYGDIVSLAVAGIDHHSTASNNAKLISLVNQRYNEIMINKDDNTAADKSDLRSIVQVLQARSHHSKDLTNYLHSSEGRKVQNFVK